MYIDIMYTIHISHVIDILQALPYSLPSKWCIWCFYRFRPGQDYIWCLVG